jgi:hypothetical protein
MLGHKICESFLYKTLPKFVRLTFLWAAGRIIIFLFYRMGSLLDEHRRGYISKEIQARMIIA